MRWIVDVVEGVDTGVGVGVDDADVEMVVVLVEHGIIC